jgi:hypothetical protein
MEQEEWSINGESYDFALDEYANLLSKYVREELLEYSISLDKFEANRLAKKWMYELEANRPEEVLNLLSSDSLLTDISRSVVETILLNIAEERPGTNPWEHEAYIPIPLNLAISQISTLGLASSIATRNEDQVWAENATSNIIAASNYIASEISQGRVKKESIEISFNGEVKNYVGMIVYIPQPAGAYIARFFDNVILRIVEQAWIIPEDSLSWTQTIGNLKIQSDLLRYLNKTHGRDSSAGASS